jgi:hypothetical protein
METLIPRFHFGHGIPPNKLIRAQGVTIIQRLVAPSKWEMRLEMLGD